MRQMRILVVVMVAAALALGTASCKDNLDPSLLEHMGGIDGVAKLMDSWKEGMAADASLTNVLTQEDRNQVALGMVNEIAKATETPMPEGGVDLLKVLKDKNLSKESLKAMGAALNSATTTWKLSPEATKGVTGLWNNVAGKAD
jgi:hypothetical protein